MASVLVLASVFRQVSPGMSEFVNYVEFRYLRTRIMTNVYYIFFMTVMSMRMHR